MDAHKALKRKVMKEWLVVILLCLVVKIVMPIIPRHYGPPPKACSAEQLSNMGKDDEAAIRQWRQAADQDDTVAQYHLG